MKKSITLKFPDITCELKEKDIGGTGMIRKYLLILCIPFFLCILIGCNTNNPPEGITEKCWNDSKVICKSINDAMKANEFMSDTDTEFFIAYQEVYYNQAPSEDFYLCDWVTCLGLAHLHYMEALSINDETKQKKYIKRYDEIAKKLKDKYNIKL